MENKSYQLRYLPLFEQDLTSTANYITNVLKNEDAALRLIDDVETAILEKLNNPVARTFGHAAPGAGSGAGPDRRAGQGPTPERQRMGGGLPQAPGAARL